MIRGSYGVYGMLGRLCIFLLEQGITKHECMKTRKESLVKE
jgi:hypothetical protein